VDAISSRPSSRLGGVNTAGMNKLEARKMQMLVSQRKKLEWELLVLEDEILNAVQTSFESVPSWTDPNHRRGNRCPKPGSKNTRGCDPDFNSMEGSRMMHEDRTGFRGDLLTRCCQKGCVIALMMMLTVEDNVALVTRGRYRPTAVGRKGRERFVFF
jgi:hypothetical protein